MVLAVRNVDKGNEAVKQLREAGVTNGEAVVEACDLADLESIRVSYVFFLVVVVVVVVVVVGGGGVSIVFFLVVVVGVVVSVTLECNVALVTLRFRHCGSVMIGHHPDRSFCVFCVCCSAVPRTVDSWVDTVDTFSMELVVVCNSCRYRCGVLGVL